MTTIPPGLTCATCGRPLAPDVARRTTEGFKHSRACVRGCSIEGCHEPHCANGYCRHHDKLRRTQGHPLGKPVMDLEDIEWMAETGESMEGAARRLGRKVTSVQRFLEREGRHDLARLLRSRDRMAAA